jgi:hypothetical protein
MKTPNDYYTAMLNALENGESLAAVLEGVGGVISGLLDKSPSMLDRQKYREMLAKVNAAHTIARRAGL